MDRLGLDSWLVSACREMGIVTPTPIQEETIPLVLEGCNVIGKAMTGTGKTAAFALPVLQKLSMDPYGVFAVVCTPARELALQIADQFNAFGGGCQVQVVTVVGGMDIVAQTVALQKRPHIIIATPGRLAEVLHYNSSLHKAFAQAQFLVLDEADRLMQPEFLDDLRTIIKPLPPKDQRQTILMSATLHDETIATMNAALGASGTSFNVVSTMDDSLQVVEKLDQRYIFLPFQTKDTCLVQCLLSDEFQEQSMILFVATCTGCQELSLMLTELEIDNVALHSGLTQQRRLASLGKFKSGHSRILVATDVAGRGIDIPAVNLVVNYDIPRNPADYLHRVGRTARSGRAGTSIALVTQYDVKRLLAIEAFTGEKLTEMAMEDRVVVDRMKLVAPARRMARLKMEQYAIKDASRGKVVRKKRFNRV